MTNQSPLAHLLEYTVKYEALKTPGQELVGLVSDIAKTLDSPSVKISVYSVDAHTIETVAETVSLNTQNSGAPQVLPILWQQAVVGQLAIRPPVTQTLFNGAQLEAIGALAKHIGVLVHQVREAYLLRHAREKLVLEREEERRRLRRDLHDAIGPTLAALSLRARVATALLETNAPAAHAEVRALRDHIRLMVATLRRVIYGLRPPALDELGLLIALREHTTQLTLGGLPVNLDLPEQIPALSAALEVALYHIALEALTNITQHAEAHQCWVRLAVNDDVQLEILDDGLGLPEQHTAGIGLKSMCDRATELGGTCEIKRRSTGGSSVSVILPLTLADADRPMGVGIVN